MYPDKSNPQMAVWCAEVNHIASMDSADWRMHCLTSRLETVQTACFFHLQALGDIRWDRMWMSSARTKVIILLHVQMFFKSAVSLMFHCKRFAVSIWEMIWFKCLTDLFTCTNEVVSINKNIKNIMYHIYKIYLYSLKVKSSLMANFSSEPQC